MTSFEKIQNAALARLEAGEDLEHILQDYADYEEELRPVLEEASGQSIASLMSSPRPKAKLKAKQQEPNKALVPLFLVLLVVLGAGVYLLLGSDKQVPEPTPFLLIDPTGYQDVTPAPTDFVQVDTSQCAAVGQQSILANPYQPQGQQAVANNSEREETGDGLELAVMATPSPMATMASLVEAAPPIEEPVVSGSGGSTGEGGASGSPADTGGYDAVAGESGRSTADSSTTSDIAVVGGLAPIVPTSVMSYDEAEADSDDFADAEREVSEYAVESSVVSAPSLDNQVVLMPLSAGEIDDNADWDTYQEYRRNFLAQPYLNYGVRDLDTTDRQIISVVDENGLPVLGACVQIYYGESFITASRTYATGLSLFFPNLSDATRYLETFRVVVTKGDVSTEASLDRSVIGGLTTVTLLMSQTTVPVQLDVMFLLDATGSMSDEIAQLQTNILSISAQLDALPNDVDVRFGLVSYRDRGDEYVTRVYDFTSDVQLFQDNLRRVVAGGGGDYPESLNEGFHMALNAVNWRGEDTIKLVFLVADAPPHVDYANDADYAILMQDSLARGIKVHPIASSGLQPEGEYILRQIGQFTMGHFLFLTYDEGVAGTVGEDRPDLEVGDARDEQGVGDYSVAQLDELVLRLITDEIAALQGE